MVEREQRRPFGVTFATTGTRREHGRSLANVDFLHGLAAARVICGAIDQHAAFIHHGHAIGKREHAIDVVLDQKYWDVPRNLLHQLAYTFALGGGEPGKRFVKQQQARRRCECQSHVEQALPPVGQRSRLRAFNAGQAEKADEFGGLGDHRRNRLRACPPIEVTGVARLHREPQVLLDREQWKQIRHLKRAREPRCDDAMRRLSGEVPAVEDNASAVRRIQARDQVEDCRFAGAVGTDQRMQRTIGNLDTRFRHRVDAAKRLRQSVRDEERAFSPSLAAQERGHRHSLLDRATRHRGGLDHFRAERRRQSPPHAD